MIIKRLKIFLVLLFIYGCASTTKESEHHCSEFKIGKFITRDDESGQLFHTIRNDSLQTEWISDGSTKQVSRIVWKNDCEYDLYKIVSDGQYPRADSIRGHKPLHVTITKATGGYCIFSSWVDGIDLIYSDTMFIDK